MYTYCRSCWITVLVLPSHVFEEAILQTSKFITYSYNIQIIHILVSWNLVENGEKTWKLFCHNISK
jgi:hypothetical protein